MEGLVVPSKIPTPLSGLSGLASMAPPHEILYPPLLRMIVLRFSAVNLQLRLFVRDGAMVCEQYNVIFS